MPVVSREVRVPALPAGLDDIQDLINDMWSLTRGIAEHDRYRFEAAVVEVAANIVEHARPADDRGHVTLDLSVTFGSEELRAEFCDDGQAADVDLDDVTMPGTHAEDGRGLALAKTYSDALRYARRGSVNRWTITCRLMEQTPVGLSNEGVENAHG